MTEAMEPDASPGDVKLPPMMRLGWRPREIIYTRYELGPDGKPRSAPGSYVVEQTDIENFVRGRLAEAGLPPHVRTRQWNSACPRKHRDINIYVGTPCWVVIELDAAENWQFEPHSPGITAKKEYRTDNGGLKHVMPDGTIANHLGPSGDGCKIIYFGVNARQPAEPQEFRCHVVRGAGITQDPDWIDPDIPNDGGRFPMISEWDESPEGDEVTA
jgi:hypothetical protein